MKKSFFALIALLILVIAISFILFNIGDEVNIDNSEDFINPQENNNEDFINTPEDNNEATEQSQNTEPSDDFENRGGFSLEGIAVNPKTGVFYFLTEGEPFDDIINEDLKKSKIYLIFSIENTDFTNKIEYSYREGYKQLELDNLEQVQRFENWEYDTKYDFSVKFVVESENEIIKSYSIFDQSRYIYGTFNITKKYGNDEIEYSNLRGNFLDSNEKPSFVYIGEASDAQEGNIYAYSVDIQEYGWID